MPARRQTRGQRPARLAGPITIASNRTVIVFPTASCEIPDRRVAHVSFEFLAYLGAIEEGGEKRLKGRRNLHSMQGIPAPEQTLFRVIDKQIMKNQSK